VTVANVREEWATTCLVGDYKVVVYPEAVIGAFAVHLRIRHRVALGPGYTVTHRASGLAVWKVPTFDRALAVATWLDEQAPIPVAREEAFQWIENLSPEERTEFVTRLTAVGGPRDVE
jgi:hypothetical protein